MDKISASDFNYLAFVLPGFALVWTYRYFRGAPKMGEFEYAAWSFIWGLLFQISLYLLSQIEHLSFPDIPYSLPAIDGMVLALVPFAIFFGYVAALIVNWGGLRTIHNFLFDLADGKKFQGKFIKWFRGS